MLPQAMLLSTGVHMFIYIPSTYTVTTYTNMHIHTNTNNTHTFIYIYTYTFRKDNKRFSPRHHSTIWVLFVLIQDLMHPTLL